MPSLEALPNAAVGSSKSLVLQVGAPVNHGVRSAPRGCLWFVKGATLMLSHMADCGTVFASVSRSVRAAASTDCFLSDFGFWLLGVRIRLGGERHPDHNGGVPSSPL